MNEQERAEIREIITMAHTDHQQLCLERFVMRKNLMSAVWAMVVLMVGAIAGAVGWAMSTQSAISNLMARSEAHEKTLTEISSLQRNIDAKFDQIRTLLIEKK